MESKRLMTSRFAIKYQIIITMLLLCVVISSGAQNTNIAEDNRNTEAPIALSKKQVIEDFDQIKGFLERYSSYIELKGFDYATALKEIISNLPEEIDAAELAQILEKFIGSIGDRHSKVIPKGTKFTIDKYLPFIVAPLGDKVVALKKNAKAENQYLYFFKKYPYLKAIDGIPINEFMDKAATRSIHAPTAAKHYRNVMDLRTLGLQYYKLNKPLAEEVSFTFTNGRKDKIVKLAPLHKRIKRWRDKLEWDIKKDTFKILEPNVGYIKISAMFSYKKSPSFYKQLPEKMREYKNTNAIIIDIRNNGGGSRDILNILAPYFIAPEAKPWVANIAKLRCDQNFNEDMSSMTGRYLFSYRSEHFSDKDRKSIDEYMKGYETEWNYDESKYSAPFYMIFSHDRGKDHYYYDKPVYVLVNERCFSAASVFTTTLKGMGNIKIVGVNTDGSSGRSNYFELKYSKIKLRLSTMISFQRNGKTLDTNGTEPDISIVRDMDQVLGKKDTQLEELLKMIKANISAKK